MDLLLFSISIEARTPSVSIFEIPPLSESALNYQLFCAFFLCKEE